MRIPWAFAISLVLPSLAFSQFAVHGSTYSGAVIQQQYVADPATGKLVPPSTFTASNYPEALQKLQAEVAAAHIKLQKADDDAILDLHNDAQYQSLASKLEDAKKAVDDARQNGGDLQLAAKQKVSASSDLNGYTNRSVAADPEVIKAQKDVDAKNSAVDNWKKTHEYSSVGEMIEMAPALEWLSKFTDDQDKYVWADQFFQRINDDLDHAINGHMATITMGVSEIEGSPDALAIGLSTASALHAKAVRINYLTIDYHADLPLDGSIVPGSTITVSGKIHATVRRVVNSPPPLASGKGRRGGGAVYSSAPPAAGGFALDIELRNAKILASTNAIPGGVAIQTPDNTGAEGDSAAKAWSGSGFLISGTGLILTNRHVATADGRAHSPVLKAFVTLDNLAHSATVVAVDGDQDLALLQINLGGAQPFLHFNSNDLPTPGTHCSILGYPGLEGADLGSSLKITQGAITGIHQNATNDDWATEGSDLLMDAKANPGNSGGPILDRYGNVVGILCAKTRAGAFQESYSIGISSGHVRAFLKKHQIVLPPHVNDSAPLEDEQVFKNASPALVRIEGTSAN